eukprot:TRINITY_DN981_c0_g1_i2.p1 TRINITY_DN981_c0_g1~~TRINITY_DN981_c0_g1_i2.p1  ORF type:complete len:375 (-),score=104.91 TRINITY_DN981_c0_g1_i2:330-1454(-)
MASITPKSKSGAQVLDGSDIRDLVENEEVFSSFVDHKFQQLDRDCDGNLSVRELQPAVADIGAALGLPAQGSSPDSDHIYTEVLNEFTHGKQEKVSKIEFKEVLSDFLLGMAAGLKRDPIVILRIDGEDLLEFLDSPTFQPDATAIFSQIESTAGSLQDYMTKALEQLTVEHGMPPPSDPWVFNNIVKPTLESCSTHQQEQPISQEMFLEEFSKFLKNIAQHLKEEPAIVAHTENTFDGSSIKKLLSNKFELEKALDTTWKDMPKDREGKASKVYLRVALDGMSPAAGLPPYGALEQMDKVVNEVFKMVNAEDSSVVAQDEFKKIMMEILGSIVLQLEGNPISISSNSVVHEPLSSPSVLLPPMSSSSQPSQSE